MCSKNNIEFDVKGLLSSISNNRSNLNSSSPKLPCPSISSHMTPPYHHVTISVGSSLELCTDYQQHMLFFFPSSFLLPTTPPLLPNHKWDKSHQCSILMPQRNIALNYLLHFINLSSLSHQHYSPVYGSTRHDKLCLSFLTFPPPPKFRPSDLTNLSGKKITLSSLGSYLHGLQRRAQYDSAIPASSLTEVEQRWS